MRTPLDAPAHARSWRPPRSLSTAGANHSYVGISPGELHTQNQLRDLAAQPNIVIKIAHEIVNLDDALSGRVIEGNGDVAEINKVWEDIREAALR
jgi:hypothetical protein